MEKKTKKEIKSFQLGCGYCTKEVYCKIRDPKINKAKQGCIDWLHWEDDPNYKKPIIEQLKPKKG